MAHGEDHLGGEHLHHTDARSSRAAVPSVTRSAGSAHWAVYGSLVALVAVVDQLTKAWVVASLAPGRSMSVIGDLVRFVYSQNTGGLFGLFTDNASVFAVASVAIVGGIVWYHGRAGRSAYLSVALGLLTGGAIGNLVDRLTRGHVVDFVDAGIGDLRWYTFNVADAAISTALVLLVAAALRPSLAAHGAPPGEAGSGAGAPAGGPDPAADA